ncbi:MAG: HAMP domain-containing sensor histidine kinase [Elusimicrobiota bacterium]
MKIGAKVGLTTGALTLLLVGATSALFFYLEKRALSEEIQNRPQILVQTLRQIAQESLSQNDDILLLNFLRLIRKTDGVVYGLVADGEGNILAHTDTGRLGTKTADSEKPDAPGVVALSLPLEGSPPGGVVRLGFSEAYVDGLVRSVVAAHQKRALGVTAGALALGLLLSLVLAGTLVRPIRRLAEATAIIGKGKLDHVIPVESSDELGALAKDFNKMAEQLKELDQMKKDFVSSVTHELRSPLHSTRLYLGLFFKGGTGPLNPKQEEYLKVIENNTIRLARFIDDLLDLAKVERGKLEVQRQEFALPGLLDEMRAMFMPHAEQKKIRFETSAADGLAPAMGDPERTRQILINLLSNAFKFTPEGGVVTLIAAGANGGLAVSVKDTGMGIPPDQLDSVFNKFEQVKGVRVKMVGQQKGTGLGLAIVKALVEAQGGKISVESVLEKGSTFRFTLPAAR